MLKGFSSIGFINDILCLGQAGSATALKGDPISRDLQCVLSIVIGAVLLIGVVSLVVALFFPVRD